MLAVLPIRPFDSAATVHPEQAERVEGWRRGSAQGEHRHWKLKDPITSQRSFLILLRLPLTFDDRAIVEYTSEANGMEKFTHADR